MRDRRRRRVVLLWSSLGAGMAGSAAVLAAAPGCPWLLVLPLLAWGGLFMAWAYLKLKDPHYYDTGS